MKVKGVAEKDFKAVMIIEGQETESWGDENGKPNKNDARRLDIINNTGMRLKFLFLPLRFL